MKKIIEIPATISANQNKVNKKCRVAAYCRVSTEKEEQENSLENQIRYYKNKIENTTNWTLVDIFADFGISGMNDKNRLEFQRMIEMCDKGKIDLIVTKSISRFARNTVDCLTYVRKLKANNIGVIFEKEGINTLDAVSETFLTWFSAFAQAESESLSLNVTRGKRMGYKEGKFTFPSNLYGYRKDENNNPQIIPEQASVVRKIYHLYLEGNSIQGICKWLNENNIETPNGAGQWNSSTIDGILKNEKYKGDVLLQKSYTVDYLTKTVKTNKGEVAQYYIENNHEGIVSKEVFDMVQDEIRRRASLYGSKQSAKYSSKYALTGKVICGECGAAYRRVTWSRNGNTKIVWRCIERLTNGTKNCKYSPTIREEDLYNAVLESIKIHLGNIDCIKDKVKEEIEAVLYKDDDFNPQVIKRKIRNYEKEVTTLRNILKETDDKEFYGEKIKKLEMELQSLNEKLLSIPKKNCDSLMQQIEKNIDDTELNMNDYFNTIVRNVVGSIVIVSKDEVKIKYIGGAEARFEL